MLISTALIIRSANKRASQTNNLPNIIFYISDDQDKYDYGCYGNYKIKTPSVDRLAREGMIFENAFTAQAICAPSRSQLYSGSYPLKNGCFLNHIQTKDDLKSVTKYMRDLGYEVILAGKSHVKPSTGLKFYRVDKGWAACHNSDIWAKTDPVGDFGYGNPKWASWNLAGEWLRTHLWEHYLFTLDKEFFEYPFHFIDREIRPFRLV